MPIITAAVISGAAALGSAAISSNAAGDAQDAYEEMVKKALKEIARAEGIEFNLDRIQDGDLPELRLEQADLFGMLQDVIRNSEPGKLSENIQQAILSGAEEGAILGAIGTSFRADVANRMTLLEDVAKLSAAETISDEELRRASLERFLPGSTGARESLMEGLASFLGFELPTGVREELQRQSIETAYRTGSVGGGPQAQINAARLLDYQTAGFFNAANALSGAQAGALPFMPTSGLNQSLLPVGGTTLSLEEQNRVQRNQMMVQNEFETPRERYYYNLNAANQEAVTRFDQAMWASQARINAYLGIANSNAATASAANQQTGQALMQAGSAFAGAIPSQTQRDYSAFMQAQTDALRTQTAQTAVRNEQAMMVANPSYIPKGIPVPQQGGASGGSWWPF